MTTTDVKPWEPVRGYYVDPLSPFEGLGLEWEWGRGRYCEGLCRSTALRVLLANGQKIIVKRKEPK